MSTATALITLDVLKAEDVFAAGGPERIIAQVEAKVAEVADLDATTDEGRCEIKSLAYKITRTKTGIDDLGKDYVAEMKKRAGLVDAGRRLIREKLDALRDQVRRPVDEWEAAEESRIEQIAQAIVGLEALEKFEGEVTVDDVDSRILALNEYRGQDFQEMADRATQLIERIGPTLVAKRQALVQREEERAELERLRKAEADRLAAEQAEQAEHEKREREEQIAKEAADRARQEAEEARLAAIARAERAEANARAAAAKAEEDRCRQAEAAEESQRAAVEAERKRIEAEQARERQEAEARSRDQEHRREVNRAAVADLVANVPGLSEEMARAVVLAIVKGAVPRVTLTY
ncbi:MAG: hypothetical protein IT537_08615 [Hyphomicrobiales bacterium]|nr:hypothetical protein [Hyphomicrobiales bacterium]